MLVGSVERYTVHLDGGFILIRMRRQAGIAALTAPLFGALLAAGLAINSRPEVLADPVWGGSGLLPLWLIVGGCGTVASLVSVIYEENWTITPDALRHRTTFRPRERRTPLAGRVRLRVRVQHSSDEATPSTYQLIPLAEDGAEVGGRFDFSREPSLDRFLALLASLVTLDAVDTRPYPPLAKPRKTPEPLADEFA